MTFELNKNYCILTNSINQNLLTKLNEYTIYNDEYGYKELKEIIENYYKKTIVFNDCLRRLRQIEKKKLIELIHLRNMNYINVTSNIEETLLCDYIYVFNNDELVMEGQKEGLLQEEKLLKRLGFGLPFVVDISTQLKYYNIVSKIYYDMEELVNDLWN